MLYGNTECRYTGSIYMKDTKMSIAVRASIPTMPAVNYSVSGTESTPKMESLMLNVRLLGLNKRKKTLFLHKVLMFCKVILL